MRLSICIPTYNRGPFLGQLFESILGQTGYECEIEVVISDNASSDETKAVIEAYRDRFDRFVTYHAPANMGADRNFLKVVEIASGDFCWLMGSDDVLEAGGIARVEAAIASEPDVSCLSVRNSAYDYQMSTQLVQGAPGSGAFLEDCTLTDAREVFRRIGDYFGYISSNVIHRGRWNDVVRFEDVSPYFNAYVHVYVIGRMLQKNPVWRYVADPCVGWRAGNDSFLTDGIFRRMEIDVRGFDQIGAGLFGRNSETARYLNRRMLHHVTFHILGAKWKQAPRSFFTKARALTMQMYKSYPMFWLRVFPLFYIPTGGLEGGRFLYRMTLKKYRQKRLVASDLAARK